MRDGEDSPDLLSNDQVRDFWDQRHLRESSLRAGGDIGLSEQDNAIFYHIRLGLLLQALVGDGSLPSRPSILDAGCGKGWFSRRLAELGFDVLACDASPSAIEFARRVNSGPEYHVATLAAVRPLRYLDAVVSIDVMFHITQDSEWSSSVENLGGIVRPGGLFIVSETMTDLRRVLGNYIVQRPKAEYLEILSPMGYRHREVLPYRFLSNPLGFHVYQRVWCNAPS